MAWKGLATLAGVLVLAVHCESARHDGPPPPPLPPCTDAADPFTDFTAAGEAYSIDGGPRTAVVTLSSTQAVGYRLDAVRVTGGGTLVDFADKSRPGGRTEFSIAINTDGSGGQVTFEVDLGCGAATMTKHYAFTLGVGRYFDVAEG
jgi:hypothetical protein